MAPLRRRPRARFGPPSRPFFGRFHRQEIDASLLGLGAEISPQGKQMR